MGRYRIPTLRNLAFTAPYFHDGSAASLEEVITVYENGGRYETSGIYKGDGRKNPYKNHLINGIRLTSQEKKALISFLLSLSDSSVCNNPLYANPFKEDETKK
jgi:cytochrome c peroxidase